MSPKPPKSRTVYAEAPDDGGVAVAEPPPEVDVPEPALPLVVLTPEERDTLKTAQAKAVELQAQISKWTSSEASRLHKRMITRTYDGPPKSKETLREEFKIEKRRIRDAVKAYTPTWWGIIQSVYARRADLLDRDARQFEARTKANCAAMNVDFVEPVEVRYWRRIRDNDRVSSKTPPPPGFATPAGALRGMADVSFLK